MLEVRLWGEEEEEEGLNGYRIEYVGIALILHRIGGEGEVFAVTTTVVGGGRASITQQILGWQSFRPDRKKKHE